MRPRVPTSAPAAPPARAVPGTLTVWAEEHHLTPAEVRVLEHSVRGLANKEIAHALGVAPSTVRSHLESICRKLGVGSRGELAHIVFTVIETASTALAEERKRLISELQVERAHLERERSLLDAVLRQSPIAIVVAEPETGRLVLANEEARRLLGGALTGGVATPGEPLAAQLRRALAGTTTTAELVERGTTDVPLTLEASAAPVRERDGRVVAGLLVFSDVTARRRAEAALREGEARFRTMAETVPDIIFTARPDGVFEYVNPQFVVYAGATGAEEGGWLAAIHADDRAETEERWRRARATLQAFEARFRLRRADGAYRWFIGRARPVVESGRVMRWLGVCTDVEDLARAEHAACEAVRCRDQFLAVISRDLRTPAENIARVATSLAQKLAVEGGPALRGTERSARYMADQSRTMSALLAEVLDLGKIDSGQYIVRAAHLYPKTLVKGATQSVAQAARTAGVHLAIDLPADLPLVVADAEKVRQVLVTLLARAIAVTPAGGTVRVSTSVTPDGEVRFTVADEGPPLSPEQQVQLFDRYWLAAVGSQRGVGLSLLVARRLVECHFGRLWIETTARGSAFHFTLPCT